MTTARCRLSRGENGHFSFDALAGRVTIKELHFVRPRGGAIWIYAVGGLAVAGCRIENVEPSATFGLQAGQPSPLSAAIFVGANPHPPNAAQPGQPENFSGRLSIVNNYIDVDGTAAVQTLGIVIFSVGRSPDREVDLNVSGNDIKNVTEPAINFRYVGGRATSSAEPGKYGRHSGRGGSRCDSGRRFWFLLIAHNLVACSWADPAAVGINVFGQPSQWAPEVKAIVMSNFVIMSAPEGTIFGTAGAGSRSGASRKATPC